MDAPEKVYLIKLSDGEWSHSWMYDPYENLESHEYILASTHADLMARYDRLREKAKDMLQQYSSLMVVYPHLGGTSYNALKREVEGGR